MYYSSIYSQLFNFIPRYRFEKIVNKSDGDRYCKHFTAWKQFLTLLFAQISGKDSLLLLAFCRDLSRKRAKKMERVTGVDKERSDEEPERSEGNRPISE